MTIFDQMIVSEQNAKQATKIADNIFVLEDGKIALSGNKNIFKGQNDREYLFGQEITIGFVVLLLLDEPLQNYKNLVPLPLMCFDVWKIFCLSILH